MWIYSLLILLQIIIYSILLGRLVKYNSKRDNDSYKRILLGLLFLFIFSGFFFKMLPGSKTIWSPIVSIQDKAYTKRITGIPFKLNDPLKKLDAEPSFNGDGFSYYIYALPEEDANYFKEPDSSFYLQFPKDESRTDWKTNRWTSTPLLSKDMLALNFINSDPNSRPLNISKILTEKGNYYAYHIRYHEKDSVGDIDFFVISPKRKVIIIINHYT